MFLEGGATTRELVSLIKAAKEPQLAVAFWGAGAAEELGLLSKGSRATVVCNLGLGGTNPDEIERLIRAKVRVLRKDDLHAKVYLGEDHCILGSSNASANGLSMQGVELSGWREANILIRDESILAEIRKWFSRVEREARSVTPADLASIKPMWIARRRSIPPPAAQDDNLLEALSRNPNAYRDKSSYVLIFDEWNSLEGDRVGDETRRELEDEDWGAFENWSDIPDGIEAIAFYLGPRGGFECDGIFRFPDEALVRRTESGIAVKFGKAAEIFAGFRKRGSDAGWKSACMKVAQSKWWRKSDGTACIDLGEFARFVTK